MPIPNQIARFRRELRLLQADLAKDAGLTRGRLSLIESGYTLPTPSELAQIAEALGKEAKVLYPRDVLRIVEKWM